MYISQNIKVLWSNELNYSVKVYLYKEIRWGIIEPENLKSIPVTSIKATKSNLNKIIRVNHLLHVYHEVSHFCLETRKLTANWRLLTTQLLWFHIWGCNELSFNKHIPFVVFIILTPNCKINVRMYNFLSDWNFWF